MNCPKCNASNPIDVVFCVSCGEPISPSDQKESPQQMSKINESGYKDPIEKISKIEANEKKKLAKVDEMEKKIVAKDEAKKVKIKEKAEEKISTIQSKK
jgi:hypothetical protein